MSPTRQLRQLRQRRQRRRLRDVLLALLLPACLVAVGVGAAAPPASAAPFVTGRVVDVTTGAPVAGLPVRLLANNRGRPGAVVDTAVTNRNGYFALEGPPRPGGYFVHHPADRYQGGFAGGVDEYAYLQQRLANADTYAAGTAIGRLYANPAFIRGFVVDSATGQRVPGVKVTARSANDLASVEASDTTDRAGRFVLNGIDFEDDGALRFNGAGVGHEVGYLACDYTVVPTFGEACASPLGVLAKGVRLD